MDLRKLGIGRQSWMPVLHFDTFFFGNLFVWPLGPFSCTSLLVPAKSALAGLATSLSLEPDVDLSASTISQLIHHHSAPIVSPLPPLPLPSNHSLLFPNRLCAVLSFVLDQETQAEKKTRLLNTCFISWRALVCVSFSATCTSRNLLYTFVRDPVILANLFCSPPHLSCYTFATRLPTESNLSYP
jgi:hypothetical protein